jgi:tight adherence protein B
MIRTLIVVVCTIAFYFIFYLLAVVQTSQKRQMGQRMQALFDKTEEQSENKRSQRRGSKTHARWLDQIAEELYVAGVALRADEFVMIWILTGAVIPAISLFLGAPLTVCIALVLVGVAAPISWVIIKRNTRLTLLGRQLSDALGILCSALRVGQSVQTAMKNVAEEMQEPISREFMRVYRETQYGMTLEASLGAMVKRTKNPDLELMCSAILIQRQIGGNLAQILQNISDTINQRIQMRGEVKTLTSAGRMSGYIIGALPVVIILILMLINPSYIEMFFSTRTGQIMLVISAVLEAIGFLFVRKIVNIKM